MAPPPMTGWVSRSESPWFPDEGRVAHISLVFREMWDTTALSLRLSINPIHLAVNIGGIPHLAKNQRDVGHPSFVRERERAGLAFHELFVVDHELWIGACSQLMQIHTQAFAFAACALRMDTVEEPVQAVAKGQYNTEQSGHT